MAKPPSTWKDIERFVAQYLGGVRKHWAPEDVGTELLSIECKHGAQIPKTVLKWWDQAQRNSGGRVPVLVLHPPYWPRPNSLVCLRLKDFKELVNVDSSGEH